MVDIKVMGRRVYVSDVQEAIHFLYYRPHENQLVIFADEAVPRLIIYLNIHALYVYIFAFFGFLIF